MRVLYTIFLMAALLPHAAHATPQVVASIKPLHGLVMRVMQGAGEPALLLTGHATPHDYQLRPSDRRRLAQADLVFYIGSQYEFFLKPLAQKNSTWVDLSHAENVALLPLREGELWNGHEHGEAHGAMDMHYWLDPVIAQNMVTVIAGSLAQKDAEHASLYHANAKRLQKELAALDAELQKTFAPVKGKKFLLFHDATQYLEKRYGLTAAGTITAHPDQPLSAHRLSALQALIRRKKIDCLLQEPPYDERQFQTLAGENPIRRGKLDPEALQQEAGPDAYFIVQRQMAKNIRECLAN